MSHRWAKIQIKESYRLFENSQKSYKGSLLSIASTPNNVKDMSDIVIQRKKSSNFENILW